MSEIDRPSLEDRLWKLCNKSRTFQDVVLEERPWISEYQVRDFACLCDIILSVSNKSPITPGWTEPKGMD
jgi:hypothetical protein